jgi:hypothetical protein
MGRRHAYSRKAFGSAKEGILKDDGIVQLHVFRDRQG